MVKLKWVKGNGRHKDLRFMFEPPHSHREVLPLRVSLPFFAGAMVMIFIVILSLFPQNSLVICSVGISTHWTWQNQASLRPPKMHSEALNWLPFLQSYFPAGSLCMCETVCKFSIITARSTMWHARENRPHLQSQKTVKSYIYQVIWHWREIRAPGWSFH